ncbi:MAG: LD-carboxypeptidase [Lachnospiraceae bacterium]|nr:LD-carboxypeptidase [Lachnospiraceae bacterium]
MKVGIAACSNGIGINRKPEIDELISTLNMLNVETVLAPHIYSEIEEYSGTDKERAEDLCSFYKDDSIDAIYDISGGDLANGVLRFLDYDLIKNHNKMLWGYSDLTTVLNAIYTVTGNAGMLYQIRNIIGKCKDIQKKRFCDYINGVNNELVTPEYDFLQGNSIKGIVVGGNIRCFCKLTGTRYFPDMNGKILLLEAFSGDIGKLATMFNQLDDMGVFTKVSGIILGTFTQYEREEHVLSVYDLLKMHINNEVPVAKTKDIGHGQDAKGIIIGKELSISKINL